MLFRHLVVVLGAVLGFSLATERGYPAIASSASAGETLPLAPAPPALDGALALISQQPFETAQNCLTLLQTIVRNIREHPSEAKFRSFKTTTKAFLGKVAGVPGSEDALRGLGFELSAGGSSETAGSWNLRRDVRPEALQLERISSALEHVKRKLHPPPTSEAGEAPAPAAASPASDAGAHQTTPAAPSKPAVLRGGRSARLAALRREEEKRKAAELEQKRREQVEEQRAWDQEKVNRVARQERMERENLRLAEERTRLAREQAVRRAQVDVEEEGHVFEEDNLSPDFLLPDDFRCFQKGGANKLHEKLKGLRFSFIPRVLREGLADGSCSEREVHQLLKDLAWTLAKAWR